MGLYYKPGKIRELCVSEFMNGFNKFWPSRMVSLFPN